MSAGSTSQRLPRPSKSAEPKIEFSCTCGKKYRVDASKAGKHVRCKNCRLRVQVPGDDTSLSERSRAIILDELGINTEAKKDDANAAEKYTCSLCGAKVKNASGAYGEAGLVCAVCQEAMGGGTATQDGSGTKKKKKKAAQLDNWTRGTDATAARNKAIAYGVLFFLGTMGFLFNVLSWGWLGALPVSGVVAYGGAKMIFNGYLADPVQAKRPEKAKSA